MWRCKPNKIASKYLIFFSPFGSYPPATLCIVCCVCVSGSITMNKWLLFHLAMRWPIMRHANSATFPAWETNKASIPGLNINHPITTFGMMGGRILKCVHMSHHAAIVSIIIFWIVTKSPIRVSHSLRREQDNWSVVVLDQSDLTPHHSSPHLKRAGRARWSLPEPHTITSPDAQISFSLESSQSPIPFATLISPPDKP